MPLVINTNVSSLNSQRQLVNSGRDLDQAMERLSSGKRVNTAADDAAGLAIANRMTSQILGLNQSIRNANDGVSLIQTAEGALDETTNILQRIRELAIQSANGIYSDVDRKTLDAEVQQLKAELDRIAESTTFNGQPLLDGSLGDVALQVGSEATDTIDLSITAMDTKSLGGNGSSDVVGTAMTDTIANIAASIGGTTGTYVTINGQNVGDLTGVTTLEGFLNAFNENVSGVETSAFIEIVASTDGDGILRGTDRMDLTVIDAQGQTQILQISGTGSMNELVDQINDVAGGLIDASLNDDGRLILTSYSATSIQVAYNGGDPSDSGIGATTYRPSLSFEITDSTIEHVDIVVADTTAALTTALAEDLGIQSRTKSDVSGNVITATATISENDISINGIALSGTTAGGDAAVQAENLAAMINAKSDEHGVVAIANTVVATAALTLNSVDGSEITIDLAEAVTYASTGLLETNNATTVGDAVSSIAIDTVTGASKALGIVDRALETINNIRADLGAVSNRLEFTVNNISNVVEKTEASRSRIIDADFAAESAALSRAQVLQQASQAMLAQANARPQQVLQLLQG